MGFKESWDYTELTKSLEKARLKYGITNAEIFSEIERQDYIPASIFSKDLSPLETVAKFLKENKNYSFTKIGKILNRSEKTIWQAYSNAGKKVNTPYQNVDSRYLIPIDFLTDRRYTVFELVVRYLIDHYRLRYCEAAVILKRDDRTIWTIYNRKKNKNRKNGR
jgi:hypothetical protein